MLLKTVLDRICHTAGFCSVCVQRELNVFLLSFTHQKKNNFMETARIDVFRSSRAKLTLLNYKSNLGVAAFAAGRNMSEQNNEQFQYLNSAHIPSG